jgi:anthranilate synthase component 1
MNMTKEEFLRRKERNESFLVIEEMEGDEFTPILLYHRLKGEKKFLLESSLRNKEKGRYSFLGADPYLEIKSRGMEADIVSKSGSARQRGKVLDIVKEYLPFAPIETPFPFSGGAVGYIGYDVIRQYETIGEENEDELQMPEVHLLFYKTFLVYDHELQRISFVYVYHNEDASYEEVVQRLQDAKEMVLTKQQTYPIAVQLSDTFQSNVSKEQFSDMVNKAKSYIREGDIFQVVLSQRLSRKFQGNPFDLYRKLRITNPSPYMFYIDFQDYIVLGSSPESLLTVKGNKVTTNPIAGTRPRGMTDAEDEIVARELKDNEKEKAEHIMLVDLGRNDIGFISETGTVELDKFMVIEKYSHVMHLVSEVSGQLKQGITCFDALQYCLPAGTVSGAPKIRAMTIIDELENQKRNVYGGTVGYISFTGDMDMALAIRTMVVKDNRAYVQAGAGVVFDSSPEGEYEETINKAKALMEVMK